MNQKISIRLADENDAEALLNIYAPYVKETAITFEYDVPSLAEFRGRIKDVLKKYPYLVAEENGNIVGYAYVSPFHNRAAYAWAVTTSIYVKMDEKRKGIGYALYAKMEELLKKQGILNLNACIACPRGEDEYLTTDSILFHEKLGYQMVGKFHQCGYKFEHWYDMVWMEKHIGTHKSNQANIKQIKDIL